MAVDTSALLAVVFDEPESRIFDQILMLSDWKISAASVLEAHMALARLPSAGREQSLRFLLTRANVEVLPFDDAQCQIAIAAFKRYGRGSGHPAKLNFGDCMSYAVAHCHDLPLLFKGDDFSYTDLEPVRVP